MSGRTEHHDWGTMTWLADATEGETRSVSVARMVLNADQASSLHHHPNCEEVVLLESGRVEHEIDGHAVPHEVGACVTIAAGLGHRSRNLGDSPAVLIICYGSPAREFVEGPGR